MSLTAPFPWFIVYTLTMKTPERFWSKVVKSDGCWIWKASKRSKGYGAFVYQRGEDIIQGRAHRYSWELHYGDIPPGLCVLHHCDTPACVRPEHLWLGTKAENNADMVAKGRHVRGGTHKPGRYPQGRQWYLSRGLIPKVDKFDPEAIRSDRAAGLDLKTIALRHGCSLSHAHRLSKKEVRE